MKSFCLVFCTSVNLIALASKNIWCFYIKERVLCWDYRTYTFLCFSTFDCGIYLHGNLIQFLFSIRCISITDPSSQNYIISFTKCYPFNNLFFYCFINYKQSLSFNKFLKFRERGRERGGREEKRARRERERDIISLLFHLCKHSLVYSYMYPD